MVNFVIFNVPWYTNIHICKCLHSLDKPSIFANDMFHITGEKSKCLCQHDCRHSTQNCGKKQFYYHNKWNLNWLAVQILKNFMKRQVIRTGVPSNIGMQKQLLFQYFLWNNFPGFNDEMYKSVHC